MHAAIRLRSGDLGCAHRFGDGVEILGARNDSVRVEIMAAKRFGEGTEIFVARSASVGERKFAVRAAKSVRELRFWVRAASR